MNFCPLKLLILLASLAMLTETFSLIFKHCVRILFVKGKLMRYFFFRADLTQQKMECMKFKYLDIQDKMERSRKLLQNAQDRIERQEQVRRTVANLRQKADLYQSKLNMQKLLKESGGAMPDSECGGMPDIIGGCSGFDFPEPIINYEEEERQQDDDEATKSGMCFKNQYFTMTFAFFHFFLQKY